MNDQERKDLIQFRLTKAKDTFKEVQLHVDNELWFTAVNRLYYACYYAVIALLIDKGVQTQTHSGVRQMFGQHFIKTGLIDVSIGKFFTDLFDLRQTGDYDDFISYTRDDVIDLLKPASDLISKAEDLLIKK